MIDGVRRSTATVMVMLVPVVAGCGGEDEQGPCVELSAQVAMLAPDEGSVRWATDVPWPIRGIDVVDDLVLTTDGAASAVSIGDGSLLWSREDDHVVAHDDDLVVLQDRGDRAPLSVIDIGNGAERWSRDVTGIAAVVGDVLVVRVGRRGEDLAAFDLATGDERWRTDASPSTRVVGGEGLLVIAASPEGTVPTESLTWVDPTSGEVRWSVEVRLGVDQAITVGDTVIVRTGEGGADVAAFSALDGRERWRTPGIGRGTLRVEDGVLTIADDTDAPVRRATLDVTTGELREQVVVADSVPASPALSSPLVDSVSVGDGLLVATSDDPVFCD